MRDPNSCPDIYSIPSRRDSTMTVPSIIIPVLRGADLSHNNFHGDAFPKSIESMRELEWLKFRSTKLLFIPEEFAKLDKLEKLDLSHNDLTSLHGELVCLKNLKFLNCRHNKIVASSVPVELFNISTLTVLDLSHNKLNVIPDKLNECKSLTVLNLSHNNLKSLSEQLFIKLTSLLCLDLSHNELKTLPPQLGRLTNLHTLKLSNNPLEEHKMRQIERLKTLRVLHLANTQRNSKNTPTNIGDLINLVELNLSSNQINRVPDDLSVLKELRRLNLSDNSLEKMPDDFGDWWPKLETLNLSSNDLTVIPNTLCKLCNLKRLYLNDNKLTFEGLPAALGRMHLLEVFMAARNNLELIPESIFRCGRLKKLILTSNRLVTLPDTIHLLYDLETLELSNNVDLIMPPKPANGARNSEYYNIDFSLNTQLRLAGDPELAKLPQQQPSIIKDSIARKLRLRRRAREDVESINQVLLGGKKHPVRPTKSQSALQEPSLEPKRWDRTLEKPPIDYSNFFEPDTGQIQGLTIWKIVDFCPQPEEESSYGKFYVEDCYIVLSTQINENLSLDWKIFYWIGTECTLDKKACSAIHAVSLRNHLNAHCRTIREEQGDESDEFLGLFPDGIDYRYGSQNKSGFYTVEETEYVHRMFRLHEVMEKSRQLHLETVALSKHSLDSRFVFLIDTGLKIFIWNGIKSKNTTKQKARLLGEKLNKEERKNKAELVFCDQGEESEELLCELFPESTGDDDFPLPKTLPKVPFKSIDLNDDFEVDNYQPPRPVLYMLSSFPPASGLVSRPKCRHDLCDLRYRIRAVMGDIELLQVEFKSGHLLTKYLVPTNVYILDCSTEIFVWLGRKSSRIPRSVALMLAEELFHSLKRPGFATITSVLQGTEPLLLKTKFKDWDDVIAVDYTRTAESVSRTGANLKKWMSDQKVKIDLASLFAPRPISLTDEECQILIEAWNGELDWIYGFTLDKGRASIKTRREIADELPEDEPFKVLEENFVRLPGDELGHFYTEDCCVFLCRYYIAPEDDASSEEKLTNEDDSEADDKRLPNGTLNVDSNNVGLTSHQEDACVKYVVYFWQGRHASKMSWLTFTFNMQKFFENFGNKLEVIQMQQQQENIKFLSHFRQKFIIHQGKRKTSILSKPVSFYHLRTNSNPLTLRCIETDCDSSRINSGFCYILRLNRAVSTNGSSSEGISDCDEKSIDLRVYVWIGSKACPREAKIAEEIAREKLTSGSGNPIVTIVNEHQEPEEFWDCLGGRQEYETNSSFLQHTRLFRCSNDKGYFNVTEKCSDFCQDDLSDDDIMILDNGEQVFLWVGTRSSEVEIKLAYKSAQVYVQNLRLKDPNPRQLMLTFKGKESRKFTKCFHAWSGHKIMKDPRGDEAKFIKHAFEEARKTSQAESFD